MKKERLKVCGQDPSEAQRAKDIQRPQLTWFDVSDSVFLLDHSLKKKLFSCPFIYLIIRKFLCILVFFHKWVCMDESMEGVRKCLEHCWSVAYTGHWTTWPYTSNLRWEREMAFIKHSHNKHSSGPFWTMENEVIINTYTWNLNRKLMSTWKL